jgi:hypothetical protein
MTRTRLASIPTVIFLCTAIAIVTGCAREASPDEVEEVRFEVIPDYLGDVYRHPALGVELRPPLGWRVLDEEQRDRVVEALVAEQEEERFNLEIVDVFLHTETLSFAALSTISLAGEPVEALDHYVDSFAAALSGQDDDEIRARSVIRINDLEVTQFRHTLAGRVTFTLIFRSPRGTVAQLDYSIPANAYEDEAIKLESSIGTLHTIPQEQS